MNAFELQRKLDSRILSSMSRCKNRIPSWFGEFDSFVMRQAHFVAIRREIDTGIKWHVDHVVPINGKKVSGLNCGDNIQVIPRSLNCAKCNKFNENN